MNIRYLLLLGLVFVSGCATNSLTPKNAHKVTKEEGVVFASVTRGIKQRGALMTNDGVSASFFYRQAGQDAPGRAMNSDTSSLLGTGTDEVKIRHGKLNVANLKPGTYEIYKWLLFVPGGTSYKTIEPKAFEPIQFEVKEGTASYLGHLHLETTYGENVFGIEIEAGAIPSCEDQSERDIKLFNTYYRAFNSWPVINAAIECQ